MGCTNKRKIDEKSEKLEYFFKNYLTPLFWIAKTSATWRLKIASKSFDAFFPRKRRKVPRFQLKKTSDRKISWYLCTAKYEATFCTALTFCQNFTQIGSRSLSTCPYHWFYPLCHTDFTWRESTFIKEKCENRGLVWNEWSFYFILHSYLTVTK